MESFQQVKKKYELPQKIQILLYIYIFLKGVKLVRYICKSSFMDLEVDAGAGDRV